MIGILQIYSTNMSIGVLQFSVNRLHSAKMYCLVFILTHVPLPPPPSFSYDSI